MPCEGLTVFFYLVIDRNSTRLSIGVLTGSAGTADTEGKHFHRHSAVALPTGNIGVVCEYISDGLRSQIVGEHQRHYGVV